MKKTKIVSLVLFIGIIFLLMGCASTAEKIPPSEELIILPDSANPFQGTWMYNFLNLHYMHVIEGMNGAWYVFDKNGITKTWEKIDEYTIKRTPTGYVADVAGKDIQWSIKIISNFLVVTNDRYYRYIGEE